MISPKMVVMVTDIPIVTIMPEVNMILTITPT